MRQSPNRVSSQRRLSTNSLAKGFFLLLAVVAAPAQAAFVTEHEARLDEIFSQASFTNAIDIRYGSIVEHVAPDLLTVDNGTEFNALVNADLGLADWTLPLFFIDTIAWCNTSPTSAKGCANSSGAILESVTAGGSVGDELVAHEIGHVLGLGHPDPTSMDPDNTPENLMNGTVRNNLTEVLVATQVSDIFTSNYVLGDMTNGFYINLAPVLVVAAASVPVPGALVLMLGTLVPLGAMRRASRNS